VTKQGAGCIYVGGILLEGAVRTNLVGNRVRRVESANQLHGVIIYENAATPRASADNALTANTFSVPTTPIRIDGTGAGATGTRCVNNSHAATLVNGATSLSELKPVARSTNANLAGGMGRLSRRGDAEADARAGGRAATGTIPGGARGRPRACLRLATSYAGSGAMRSGAASSPGTPHRHPLQDAPLMRLHLLSLAITALALPAASLAQSTRSVADYQAVIEGVQATPGQNDLGRLTISELMARYNVPGVSIAVIRDGRIHWAKGYGVADVETGASVDSGTLFQAASISKPVAAMGVLRAVQDGLFTLDQDINSILTSWKLDGEGFTRDRPVTPRMLTSHTSGLGDGFGFPGYAPSAPTPTVVQILQGHPTSNVGVLFMERSPMSLMEYSGGGVTLMQLALSDARKRPFADIMRDDVLRPIGMSRSTFEQPLPASLDRNAARAHSRDGKAMGHKWHVYPEQAAAGLWTTPSDLARFVIEVQRSADGTSNRVLSRALANEMLSPVGVGDFAVGFSIGKIGQGWYFSHGGSNFGFRGMLLGHKVKGYGLVIMTNADQGSAVAAELSRRIQLAYEWDSFAEPAPRGYRPPPGRDDGR
jgi:CubicO group peptidase (beta-lactamase class C family)